MKWYHGSLWHLSFLHARDGLIDLRRLVRFWSKIPNFLKSHFFCCEKEKKNERAHLSF